MAQTDLLQLLIKPAKGLGSKEAVEKQKVMYYENSWAQYAGRVKLTKI